MNPHGSELHELKCATRPADARPAIEGGTSTEAAHGEPDQTQQRRQQQQADQGQADVERSLYQEVICLSIMPVAQIPTSASRPPTPRAAPQIDPRPYAAWRRKNSSGPMMPTYGSFASHARC